MGKGLSHNKAILIIDDQESNLDLLRIHLRKKFPAYKLILTTSGKEGTELCVKYLPNTVLLDVNMPEMNGYEVCEFIKSHPKTMHIPVLLVSAHGGDSNVRIQGLKSGADAFISKPFDPAELEALVNVMLRIKDAEDSLREKNDNLKRNIREIESYQRKLKDLNTELTKAEETERKRLADYLHDGIAQTLSIANLKLSSLKRSMENQRSISVLEDSTGLISTAITETRTLIYELNLPILNELGLIPAINWKLEQLMEKHGIQVIFTNKINPNEINKEYHDLIYRTISELLANILKHAGAQKITLVFKKVINGIQIQLNDNGSGFRNLGIMEYDKNGGYGLFRIKERLEIIKGTIHVESKQNVGSRICILIPN